MHVPWGWIKQRPHFFAESLQKDFEIDVVYKKPTIVSSKKLRKNETLINVRGFRLLPFRQIRLFDKINLEWINSLLLLIQMPSLKKYDYVWITCPTLYAPLKPLLRRCNHLIYDCMDDIIEFPMSKNNNRLSIRLLSDEKELLTDSKTIICSSDYLKNKILERSHIQKNVKVINNAIGLPEINHVDLPQNIINLIKYLEDLPSCFMYIGTISEWFDFESLQYVLNHNESIHVVLIGPSDVKIPNIERLHHLGVVDREYIFELMSHADSLIMPFHINELIKSVNPVKLYEYIYTAKPVIASKYGETEKFSEYVYLYDNQEELLILMNDIYNKQIFALSNEADRVEYIKNNTWEYRYTEIQSELTSTSHKVSL